MSPMAGPFLGEGADLDEAVEGRVMRGVDGDIGDMVGAVGSSHGVVVRGASAKVSGDGSRGLGMAGHVVNDLSDWVVEGAGYKGAPRAGGEVVWVIRESALTVGAAAPVGAGTAKEWGWRDHEVQRDVHAEVSGAKVGEGPTPLGVTWGDIKPDHAGESSGDHTSPCGPVWGESGEKVDPVV